MDPDRSLPKDQRPNAYLTDADLLKQHFKFVPDEDKLDDESTWQARMMKRYHEQLFREYALADLSRYASGQVALRWRTKHEVMAEKGSESCGSVHCDKAENLAIWEVPFRYEEHGVLNKELVKIKLCPSCSEKLTYRRKEPRSEVSNS